MRFLINKELDILKDYKWTFKEMRPVDKETQAEMNSKCSQVEIGSKINKRFRNLQEAYGIRE